MTAARTAHNATYPAAELAPAASLRELGVGGLLIVLYLVVTRIGHLEAAKIGIQIGPLPLFLTEMFMIATALVVAITRPAQIVCWLLTGGMARAPGMLLWLLFLTSLAYAAMAVEQWGILAIRDLAIFSYGIVFALAYFVLDTREKAAAAMRWFAYSGTGLAVALIVDTVSGAHIFFGAQDRIVTTENLLARSFGGGDVGGIVSFSLVALLAYAVTTAERRMFHSVSAALCLYALALAQTRSAVLGLSLGIIYSLFGMRTTQRISFVSLAAGGVLTVIALPVLLPELGISRSILSFGAAVQGGLELQHDDNFYFRLLRWDKVLDIWRENPFFGTGFGRPLIPRSLLNEVEEGNFNVGLPHNTYLTILARLGLYGFLLIMGAWITSIVVATRAIGRSRFAADAFAAGAALVVMMGYATFVLFLERPMHSATLWIVAAIACRLAEPDPVPARHANATPAASDFSRAALSPIAQARQIAHAKGFR